MGHANARDSDDYKFASGCDDRCPHCQRRSFAAPSQRKGVLPPSRHEVRGLGERHRAKLRGTATGGQLSCRWLPTEDRAQTSRQHSASVSTLSRQQFSRGCRRNGARVRPCLCCEVEFFSEHLGNRICLVCPAKAARYA